MDLYITPELKISSIRIKPDEPKTHDFLVQDIYNAMDKKNRDITYIAEINYINGDTHSGIYDSKSAIEGFRNFLKANDDTIIVFRMPIIEDYNGNIVKEESIKNLDIFLIENGFAPVNDFCQFETSYPYIYINDASREALRKILRHSWSNIFNQ